MSNKMEFIEGIEKEKEIEWIELNKEYTKVKEEVGEIVKGNYGN
jgi:hypothetical protein